VSVGTSEYNSNGEFTLRYICFTLKTMQVRKREKLLSDFKEKIEKCVQRKQTRNKSKLFKNRQFEIELNY
jgi:hypothetical protein